MYNVCLPYIWYFLIMYIMYFTVYIEISSLILIATVLTLSDCISVCLSDAG